MQKLWNHTAAGTTQFVFNAGPDHAEVHESINADSEKREAKKWTHEQLDSIRDNVLADNKVSRDEAIALLKGSVPNQYNDGIDNAGTRFHDEDHGPDVAPPSSAEVNGAQSALAYQSAMKMLGQPVTVDAVWGQKSAEALNVLQTQYNLEYATGPDDYIAEDGIPGPDSAAALVKMLEAGATEKKDEAVEDNEHPKRQEVIDWAKRRVEQTSSGFRDWMNQEAIDKDKGFFPIENGTAIAAKVHSQFEAVTIFTAEKMAGMGVTTKEVLAILNDPTAMEEVNQVLNEDWEAQPETADPVVNTDPETAEKVEKATLEQSRGRLNSSINRLRQNIRQEERRRAFDPMGADHNVRRMEGKIRTLESKKRDINKAIEAADKVLGSDTYEAETLDADSFTVEFKNGTFNIKGNRTDGTPTFIGIASEPLNEDTANMAVKRIEQGIINRISN